jgi:hypothetical protein
MELARFARCFTFLIFVSCVVFSGVGDIFDVYKLCVRVCVTSSVSVQDDVKTCASNMMIREARPVERGFFCVCVGCVVCVTKNMFIIYYRKDVASFSRIQNWFCCNHWNIYSVFGNASNDIVEKERSSLFECNR